jgi:hypothetical protein
VRSAEAVGHGADAVGVGVAVVAIADENLDMFLIGY